MNHLSAFSFCFCGGCDEGWDHLPTLPPMPGPAPTTTQTRNDICQDFARVSRFSGNLKGKKTDKSKIPAFANA
jgi:hypothetical protein